MREKTLRTRHVFRGRFLKVDVLDVEMESGQRTTREIVRHPGAVAVLAQLPDGRYVLVRQFRKPVEREVLEIVAGTLDPGEHPDTCARRELQEETGYRAARLRKLGIICAAPGYTEERLHVYYAELKPEVGATNPDDDERVRVVYMTEDELERRIRAGRIQDAKTLSAWLLMDRRVRKGARRRRSRA